MLTLSFFPQATVPSGLSNYDDTLPYENEDKQLWDPTRLSEEVTREYLAKSAETTGAPGILGVNGIPTGSHIRDDEQVGQRLAKFYVCLKLHKSWILGLFSIKRNAGSPPPPLKKPIFPVIKPAF